MKSRKQKKVFIVIFENYEGDFKRFDIFDSKEAAELAMKRLDFSLMYLSEVDLHNKKSVKDKSYISNERRSTNQVRCGITQATLEDNTGESWSDIDIDKLERLTHDKNTYKVEFFDHTDWDEKKGGVNEYLIKINPNIPRKDKDLGKTLKDYKVHEPTVIAMKAKEDALK